MYKLATIALATLAMGSMMDVARAQESNPVTSNPPVDSIGRLSETSPGTPWRQNGAPGYGPYYGPYYYGLVYSGPVMYSGLGLGPRWYPGRVLRPAW